MTQAEKVKFEKYLDAQWTSILKKHGNDADNEKYYYMGITQTLRMLGYCVERRVDGLHLISSVNKGEELQFSELDYPLNLVSDILNEKREKMPTKFAINRLMNVIEKMHKRRKMLICLYYKDKKSLIEISKDKNIPASYIQEIIVGVIKTLRKDRNLCKTLRGEIVFECPLPDISDKHFIAESDLTSRVKNSLLRAGYETFEDLNGRSWRQLFRIRGFGDWSRRELYPFLKKYDIQIKN